MFDTIQAIAFDLDGTIVDTTKVVVTGYEDVFRQLQDEGLVKDMPSKRKFLSTYGMIDDEIWMYLLPDVRDEVRRKARQMHDGIVDQGLKEERVLIPGALEVLKTLHGRYTLATASNCGTDYLDEILTYQNIDSYFSHRLCAGTIDAKEKSQVLEEIMKRLGHSNLLMVGDRKSDIDAAKQVGIPSVGIKYVFAKEDELKEADVVIDSIQDLLDVLKQ